MGAIRIAAEKLISQIFVSSGLKESDALTVADNLVQAEMHGIRSHGLVQVANYSTFMRNRKINCNAEIRTLSESDSALAIDADFAPGSVAGLYAMQKTIEKARAEGILLYDGVAGEISRTLHELNITESLDSVKK